jgi:inner membrane protein
MREELKQRSKNTWLRTSITVRLITIGVLILLLLIPVEMVQELIHEREYRSQEAIDEVSEKWGNPQTLSGPILSIPYYNYYRIYDKENSGKYHTERQKLYMHFLPEALIIDGKLAPKVRHRSIYDVIVYNANVKIEGSFLPPDFSSFGIEDKDILWNKATLSLGISDLRSIQENISLQWNSEESMFDAGLPTHDLIRQGISTHVNIDSSANKYDFALQLDVNGSSKMYFVPVGKTTQVKMQSIWPDPSFDGKFLPDTSTVSADGFVANWKVLHLNRDYSQIIKGSESNIGGSAFGVVLMMPVDDYQKTNRAAKYAVLFIGLTFLVFFFSQTMNEIKIHPVQYILVGLALVLFYTLLISISEHLGFDWAYLISAASIIGLVSFYTRWIFKSSRMVVILSLIMVILYGFIFSIIQMHDYALLLGSIGLFMVLAIVMYVSRKIDWYQKAELE